MKDLKTHVDFTSENRRNHHETNQQTEGEKNKIKIKNLNTQQQQLK